MIKSLDKRILPNGLKVAVHYGMAHYMASNLHIKFLNSWYRLMLYNESLSKKRSSLLPVVSKGHSSEQLNA